MNDITYCCNASCPFADCERHLAHAPKEGVVSIANLDGVCRRYIDFLIQEAEG